MNTRRWLTARGVAFISLGEGIDTGTAAGRLQLHILGALAEFERERIRERVMIGLARAKRQGKVLGRPPQQPPTGATVEDCVGLSVREAARVLGVSRLTAQRLLAGERPKSSMPAAQLSPRFPPEFHPRLSRSRFGPCGLNQGVCCPPRAGVSGFSPGEGRVGVRKNAAH